MEKTKTIFPIQLGPREMQVMGEFPTILEQHKLSPLVKAEIFRRGLHAMKPLTEINERPLLRLLSNTLQFGIKNPKNKESEEELIALSGAILATLIAKYGILRAEPFETIFNTCKYVNIADERVDASEMSKVLMDVRSTVDTMYLNKPANTLLTP